MRLCDFQQKEVINACDCRKLGYVADLVFDECTGCIESVIVPRGGFLPVSTSFPLRVSGKSVRISSW